jgi:hypothetical protein
MRCSRIKQHNCKSVIDEKHTNDHVQSFLGFLHSNMVDFPMSTVLLGSSNQNRVGSTIEGCCRCCSLIGTGERIGASVATMSLVSTVVAPTIFLQWVLGGLGPLNALISNRRSLESVGR